MLLQTPRCLLAYEGTVQQRYLRIQEFDRLLETRIRTRLEDFRLSGFSRRLTPPTGIDLSSNDYLLLSQHPHFLVDEANETLHLIQNGLNLKLNSWFLPLDCFLSRQQKANRNCEISYSSLSLKDSILNSYPVAGAVGEVRMPTAFASSVGKFRSWNFSIECLLPPPSLSTNSAIEPFIDQIHSGDSLLLDSASKQISALSVFVGVVKSPISVPAITPRASTNTSFHSSEL